MNSKYVLFLSLVAVTQLTACVNAAVMAANIVAGGALSKSIAERKADKCFEIETKAQKEKVSKLETNRRLRAAECDVR